MKCAGREGAAGSDRVASNRAVVNRLRMPAAFACAFLLASAGLAVRCEASDSCADNLTPQTVIVDRFEARDAAVADVLEALVLEAEKATRRAYRPNFIIVGDAIGRMRVSLDLTMAPLSEALDRIGALPGVQVTYRPNQTVIFSLKQG